ncbi:hypothetical protein [uncultured Mediterranean phage uvMED]|nr:hypothetical protein [uncultured Mediterranean phage uvMED]
MKDVKQMARETSKTLNNLLVWIDSDNVIQVSDNKYRTQCSQYKIEFNLQGLCEYYIKEYENN